MIGFIYVLCLGHLVLYAEGNCVIDGVTQENWHTELAINVFDKDSGVVFERTTSNIISLGEIKEIGHTLKDPPYFNATLRNNVLTIFLLDEFKNYESRETLSRKSYQFSFQCHEGVRKLVITFNVRDTNNHVGNRSPSFAQSKITNDLGKRLEFEEPYYLGVFDNDKSEVDFQKRISLKFDSDIGTVFTLAGDGSQYFKAVNSDNGISIAISNITIPESVILSPETIVFSLIATNVNGTEKALTVLSIQLVKAPNCELYQLPSSVWDTGLIINILDTASGDSLQTYYANILEITNYTYEIGELNDPPYVRPVMYHDRIDFEISYRYRLYEQLETRESFTMYVAFKCKRNSRVLKVTHSIKDTNNNAPILISPWYNQTYSIFTPIPANYYITKTYGELVIYDMDLTNYAIYATLSTNNYVTLKYRGPGPTKKEFVFDLITKARIDFLNSPVVLNLTFYDADYTGQPSIYKSNLITLAPL